MSFTALADLLPADLDEAQAGLPPIQREALLVALGRPGQPGAAGLAGQRRLPDSGH